MPLSIQSIRSQQQWEAFVRDIGPHSFLQSWQWGEFHEHLGMRIERRGVIDNNTLTAAYLAIVTPARRSTFVLVPHGPLVRDDTHLAEVLPAMRDDLKTIAQRVGAHFIRVCPLASDTPDHRALFKRAGFRPAPTHVHPEIAWILDITKTEEELLAQMRKTTRYSIRKAERDDVMIETSTNQNDIDRFWNVYQQTVDRQHFTPFSRAYLQKEFETFTAGGQAQWFFALYKSEVVSAALILFDACSGYYHHGASTHQFRDLTASHLLQWEAIREARRRGCRWYNFWGIAPDVPHHPWAGLTLFKRGFGGEGEHYVHAQDLPLAPYYWFAWAIEEARRRYRRL